MSEKKKPVLLIVYDYFYPAYKAGGPVQSLVNLVISLQDKFEIAVMTGAVDLNETHTLENIITDNWTDTLLPGMNEPIKVWYANPGKPGGKELKKAIKEIKPGVIYLNGIFSFRFVLLPLIFIKKVKIIICPRGMLQQGALAGKSFKKSIYISLLKLSGLLRNVSWHATNEEEMEDIKKVFDKDSKVFVASNLPKKPVKDIQYPTKPAGQLRLVYLSLIASKKNLLQTIELLDKLPGKISLDIYGPIKDKSYWEKCLQAIKKSNAVILYKGDVMPDRVQETFQQYDVAVFFTKGENFGHALYESLSSGRPIITSFFTPWNNLEEKKAGWNIDISNEQNMITTLEKVLVMPSEVFRSFCVGAHQMALNYYNQLDSAAYDRIF